MIARPFISPQRSHRRPAGGIIRPPDEPEGRERWPEAIYRRAHHTALSYTLESASTLPLAQRVAALSRATGAALECALRTGQVVPSKSVCHSERSEGSIWILLAGNALMDPSLRSG
jgi:hypothetical protein